VLIEPRRIGHQWHTDYVLNWDQGTQTVTSVEHKTHGRVKFLAILIDETVGYTIGSAVKIYSSVHTHEQSGTKFFNLVHVHVNDRSDEISFDVTHMDKAIRPPGEPTDRIIKLTDG
jgi:hypothetical protein